jgi:hypothetical protein
MAAGLALAVLVLGRFAEDALHRFTQNGQQPPG